MLLVALALRLCVGLRRARLPLDPTPDSARNDCRKGCTALRRFIAWLLANRPLLVFIGSAGFIPITSQLLGALPESLRSVESAVLDLVLNERLKDSVGASGSSGSSWGHNRSSASDIIAASREGQLDLAFVLRATPPEQVLAVARDSLLMPPKSTNFSPKPTKGLLMNSLVSF